MRYLVISKGLNISQLQGEVKRCGGRNLKVAAASKQIFCDLDDAGKDKLKAIPGLVVKDIQRVGTDQRVGVDKALTAVMGGVMAVVVTPMMKEGS